MRQRLPIHKRASDAPNMDPTDIDAQFCNAVCTYRVLTSHQLQRLFQIGKTGTNWRLSRLYQHRFLNRTFLPEEFGKGRKPPLYTLMIKGARLAARYRDVGLNNLDWNSNRKIPKSPFLEHWMETNNIRIAVALAAERLGFTIQQSLDERQLGRIHKKHKVKIRGLRGKAKRVAVIDDWYCRIDSDLVTKGLLWETDMGNVTIDSNQDSADSESDDTNWKERIRKHQALFAVPARRQPSLYETLYKTRSGRLLTATTTPGRIDKLLRITQREGGKSKFWFTNLSEATNEQQVLSGKIWRIAGQDGVHSIF